MPVGDIRPIKAGLREQYKRLRRNMPREIQDAYDETIARRVAALWQYKRCRMLLTYVSTAIEVDTRRIIERALADGKQVAVPRCVPGTRDMEFYLIRGLDELEPVLNGTTSLAVCANDPVAPAKVVAEFAKKMNGQKFVIKAGFVDGKVIDVAGVNALAELPSKEVLLSMLLSAMQGPVRGLAVSLDATISGLARALQAVADQKAG